MSQLRQFAHDGKTYISLEDIESGVRTHQKSGAAPFRLGPSLTHVTFDVDHIDDKSGATWIELAGALKLLDYYAKHVAGSDELAVLSALSRTLRETAQQKRAVARKYRWLVAYRQEYKCAHCKKLLHPLAMDVDHVKELRSGGADELDNLQCLCADCHAKKTRSYYQSAASGKKKRKKKKKKKRKRQ